VRISMTRRFLTPLGGVVGDRSRLTLAIELRRAG